MNPYRPSNNDVFAERLRSAEARRQQELEKATRAPRVTSKAKAAARRKIELINEQRAMRLQHAEIWETETV